MGKLTRTELMHGAALHRLLPPRGVLQIEHDEDGYLINGKVGVWLKATRKALPCRFTFNREELTELARLTRRTARVYVAFSIPAAGVCAVTWPEFCKLIAVGDTGSKWISVSRPLAGGFRVRGSDRKKPLIVPANRWGFGLIP